MNEVRAVCGENETTVFLSGRIDSVNAHDAEAELVRLTSGRENMPLVLDAADLQYISSAGLRVILRLRKSAPGLRIRNVSPEVYEILEMTGFTEMMPVEKAYRVVSVEGCEVIGEGQNGKVYRIDRDTVVKTYKNADALEKIRIEREKAKLALILGVPTAISYDIVRVGDSYGSVFELLNARSFSGILAAEPDRFDWCVTEYVKMLEKIHSITVPEGKLPSIKEKTRKKAGRMKHLLPGELGDKLMRLIDEIPECNTMIHGDYHTKNIVLAGDEVLVIDMDTLSVGHPIFDLMHMYNAYVGYSEYNTAQVLAFQGYPAETARRFWRASLAAYLGTDDEETVRNVEKKVRCLSYAGLIDSTVRHPSGNPEADEKSIALWLSRLAELLGTTDTLLFERNELEVEASGDRLPEVTDFIDRHLEEAGCTAKTRMQISLAAEEIFVNIANYAYAPGTGTASVRVELGGDPASVSITFEDGGKPFDPTAKTDPDVTLSAAEREIGGLGIFLTKKIMDDVRYEYREGRNILTVTKKL